MNREIKFRGKRTDGKGFAYGFYRKNTFYNRLGDFPKEIYTKHFIGCYDNISYFDGVFEQVEVECKTLGQFTGLYDKNGIEIYEGDIVVLNTFVVDCYTEEKLAKSDFTNWYLVSFCDEFLRFQVKTIKTTRAGNFGVGNVSNSHLHFFTEKGEITGNIHENA